MFLVADTTLANPPIYLVSGDLAVRLQDTQSVANFRGLFPLIQLSPAELADLTSALAPPP